MLKRARGFSLVELLIAAMALSLVVVYTMGTFTVQNEHATVIDQVSEAQQNIRSVAGLIERDLRNAGYLVPTAGAFCAADATAGPDTLYMSDTDAIRTVDDLPGNLQGQDLAAETVTNPTLGTSTINVDQIVIDGQPTYRKDTASTAADSDFRVGGGVIIVDTADTARGVACGRVTAVSTTSLTVFFDRVMALPSAPTAMRVIPAHVYRVDTTNTPPILSRDGTTLARDVEDLQAAFFYDASDDGVVDPNEYKGNTALNLLDNTAIDGTTLREVRFHVVVTTSEADPRLPLTAGRGQARENRSVGSVPGPDGRHRRVYTSVVRLRNIAA